MAEERDEGSLDEEYVDPTETEVQGAWLAAFREIGLTDDKLRVPSWRPVYEFAVHGIIGTLIFLIVAAFAVLLDLLVQWLEARHLVSWEILLGLKWMALAIFAADVFLTFVFVIKTTYRTARKL